MKTQILMIGFSMAITFFSNPATSQQTIGDNPSVVKKSHAQVITIPWYYPPLYETDGSDYIISDPASYNPAPADSLGDTCLGLEGVKCFSESDEQVKYNNPVKYGIGEYFSLQPKRN